MEEDKQALKALMKELVDTNIKTSQALIEQELAPLRERIEELERRVEELENKGDSPIPH